MLVWKSHHVNVTASLLENDFGRSSKKIGLLVCSWFCVWCSENDASRDKSQRDKDFPLPGTRPRTHAPQYYSAVEETTSRKTTVTFPECKYHAHLAASRSISELGLLASPPPLSARDAHGLMEKTEREQQQQQARKKGSSKVRKNLYS